MSDFNLARLKAERIARGYSQQKFARALGVSYVTYNQKENGKKPISIDQFVKILEILKIPDNEINIFLLIAFIKKNKKMECEGSFYDLWRR
ncbi:helix-turn-helix domain-containing protein [Lactobacillus mulieris]|uniref:helix-turn-helix domain-containing protein n=1 Tax=Lactobacillus mulieris TaxID=2508708 RepID=UPI0022CDE5D3|nr:helix-turn-helix transcriptional regulator [Lactobacillus mulieris]MCZ9599964.1 helix-turn-helix domain-containing protein [Lactobacillus mulieris]